MTDEQINMLAFLLCAAIDDGEPCGGEPCAMCLRKAKIAETFFTEETK